MSNKSFLKRLQVELPEWAARGWVNEGGQKAIIDYVGSQKGGVNFLMLSFYILGVLLFGSGVITFFASNWQEMAKLTKLIILLGGLWLSYAAAGYFLKEDRSPRLGQAFVLLGVILFGANIMLIAQMYHIQSHFPNGVLLWSVGGLLSAYVLRSQPALVAALLLAMLWNNLEIRGVIFGGNKEVHWLFLVFLAAVLPAIYCWRWRVSLHFTIIALVLWSLYASFAFLAQIGDGHISSKAVPYMVQIYFLSYLCLFLMGMVMETYDRMCDLGGTVQRYAVLVSLGCLYALTFPGIYRLRWGRIDSMQELSGGYFILTLFIAISSVVALALWHRKRTLAQKRPAYLVWGQGLIALVVVLILGHYFFGAGMGSLFAIAFNVLFFVALIWLIYAGVHSNNHFLVNSAFAFFAIGLLSRYFDTFWSLMNRSFFFMAGGIILLLGGYYLERKRRLLTAKIKGADSIHGAGSGSGSVQGSDGV